MFCPKCSQPQPAEDVRFCPRCGFHVREVKELVGREEGRAAEEALARAEGPLPAQKDLATGALLMFAGCVVAVFWGFMGLRWRPEVALPQAYFIMGGTLAFILTLFHPLLGALERLFSGGGPWPHTRRRRDGINLGAVLMFVGALKAALLTSIMPPGTGKGLTTLLIMAGMALLLLLLRPVLRVAHALFFKGGRRDGPASGDATARLDPAKGGSALPPARAVPVNDFAHARADTADLAAPPSVAEETTRKLNNL
jgi:hypothetical protein